MTELTSITRMEKIKRNWQDACRRSIWRELAVVAALLAVGLVGFWCSRMPSVAAAVAGSSDVHSVMRCHIIANSDNLQDQALKLLVRDAVVEYLQPRLAGSTAPEETAAVVQAALPQLVAIAEGIVDDHGYGASGEYGIFDFPAKQYGAGYLPAGQYPALRLVLGSGEGHNWWCLLYPPLCVVDGEGRSEAAPFEGQTTTAEVNFEVRWGFAKLWRR